MVNSETSASGAITNSSLVHLRRAWDLFEEVSNATEELRDSVLKHEANVEQLAQGSFVEAMLESTFPNSDLRKKKAALLSDIQLAHSELDRAANSDPHSAIEARGALFTIPAIRSCLFSSNGIIELIWGKAEKAKDYFAKSLELVENSADHYMLGLIFEADGKPQEALMHFERCLELDPNGPESTSALREANAMRNYKKRFRGNWLILILLIVFLWPVAIFYFIKKRK